MKKGLRPAVPRLLCRAARPALRPDEEGIKTESVGRPLEILVCPALRPDEEGIKT